MRYFYLLSLIFSLSFSGIAATYTSNSSTFGDWDIGGDPGAADDINIDHDWSGNDIGSLGTWRTNYTGTITVSSGGYFEINSSFSNFTGTITVDAGGTFESSTATSLAAGSTVTVNGYMECMGSYLSLAEIQGTGVVNTTSDVWGGGYNIALTLPVELASFSVTKTNNINTLNWKTLSEVNNAYFEIQRSYDGIHYEGLGIVVGNGNSLEVNNYSFDDKNSNKAYYRLKQYDFDGTYEYSHIIHTNATTQSQRIIQKHNSNEFYVLTDDQSAYSIMVFDLKGNLILKDTFNSFPGARFNFTIEDSGAYIITLLKGSTRIVKKAIVK